MGQCVVKYRGRHFLANPGFLQAWLQLIVQEIDHQSMNTDWLVELHDEWQFQSTTSLGGLVWTQLDKFAGNENQRETLVKISEHALEQLKNFGEAIPIAWLEANRVCGNEVHRHRDYETEKVVEVASQFIDLLSRTPTEDAP